MVRDVAHRRRHRGRSRSPSRSPAARSATRSRAGSPSAARRPSASTAVDCRFGVMTDEQRADAAREAPRRPGGHRRQPGRPRPRRGPGHPVRRPRQHHPRAAHRLRQGRRRQVVGHHQPGRRRWPSGARTVAVVDADVWGFSIPRMLGVDQPPVVIDSMLVPPEAPRRALHLDGLLRRGGPAGHLAGPDAPQGARAVPHRRVLGRSRLPARRPAARAPATSRSRWPSSCRKAEVYVVTTPQPAAQKVAQRAGFMAQKVNLRSAASSRT